MDGSWDDDSRGRLLGTLFITLASLAVGRCPRCRLHFKERKGRPTSQGNSRRSRECGGGGVGKRAQAAGRGRGLRQVAAASRAGRPNKGGLDLT